jgi:hypothetical protein
VRRVEHKGWKRSRVDRNPCHTTDQGEVSDVGGAHRCRSEKF